MKRIIFLFLMMCALNMSFAQRCESFKLVEKSEILSDGGSINLVFETDSSRRALVNYAASLNDVNILSFDGVEIKIGSVEESALLVRIDLFLKSKIVEKSQEKIRQDEMKRFIGGDEKTLVPVIGLIENLCANQITRMKNAAVCTKYLPRNLK